MRTVHVFKKLNSLNEKQLQKIYCKMMRKKKNYFKKRQNNTYFNYPLANKI